MRIRIRKMKPEDEGFVITTWLALGTNTSGLPRDHANPGVRKLIDRVLTNPRTSVLVGVDDEDPDEIVGFVVTTGDILHLLVVKREYRRSGAATALLEGLPSPLRVYAPHRGQEYLNRIIPIVLAPLSLLDV